MMAIKLPSPYRVLPDFDSGGWWIVGPSKIKMFPKYVWPTREIADIQCENLNSAYQEGYCDGE